ncbi:MAG: transposase [Nitrospira sp.]|nr:transposase [Nitrospira sp.]
MPIKCRSEISANRWALLDFNLKYGRTGYDQGRFAEEFKEEAVKQVIERGYAVGEVARRPGISVQRLYMLVKVYSPNATDRYEAELKEVRPEHLTLKAELRRSQDERDILKKAAAYFAKTPG